MKVKIVVEDLKRSLGKLSKAVVKNPTMDAIGRVRVSVKDNMAHMTCTDLSIEKSVIINCDSEDEFVISIPFFKLFNLIKTYADDKSITLTLKDDHAVLVCGKSRNKMPTFPSDDFPSVITGDKVEIEADPIAISEAISMVSFAAGRNDVMQVVNSVAICCSENGLDVVSTNKALMAIKEVNCKSEFENVLIPIKSSSVVKEDLIEATKIETDKRSLIVTGDDFETIVNLIDGKFLNYNGAIPKVPVKHQLTFSKEAMLECLNRITVIADDPLKSRCIIDAPSDSNEATIRGRFLVGDASEIDESLPIENKSAIDMEIAYNPYYLSQSMSKLDCDMVTCTIHDNKLHPLVIQWGGFTSVITQVLM